MVGLVGTQGLDPQVDIVGVWPVGTQGAQAQEDIVGVWPVDTQGLEAWPEGIVGNVVDLPWQRLGA